MKLSDFEGRWRIARVIEDRTLGRSGAFEGEARLAPGSGGLIYDEAGLLRYPGATPLRAERRYFWTQAGASIAVCFEDGRPFHVIAGGQTRPGATHECAPDTYRVAYDFANWPDWTAEWTVTGPRKDYTMRSAYAPLSG